MTLRWRLVLALGALTLVGLAAFGVVTYSLYARSEYDRLDDQIQNAAPLLQRQLDDTFDRGDEGRPGGGPTEGGPFVPLAAYGELRNGQGAVVATVQLSDATGRPDLPATLAPSPTPYFFTAGSSDGSGEWRVYVTTDPRDHELTVVAVPLDEVTDALHRLVLIEVMVGGLLLAVLCSGAWLILRRGLRPLERMADTAGEIAEGDLSQRVEPSGGPTEIGQLGLALNTMLERIEEAFAERDATEQKLRQFLADASHELRTPLTSIQGFAELFRVGDDERVDLPTILRRVEDESARMSVLVDDLLLLARLDQTRPIERAPVDLAVLAADACSDVAAAAPDHPVTLDAPAPVVVDGDEHLLRQAIGNLLANAARHTPGGTSIEVTAVAEDERAVLRVRDHGPGLDEDALAHVFDRFWQADRARAGVGTGLGLSIVAGVAAEHHGEATVENAPNGGAVFELRLPLAIPSEL